MLEARELILRGELRRSFPIAEMSEVRVEGERLHFRVAGAVITLGLGAAQAGRWAKKIATPPPSLARKLGVGPSSKVMVMGPIEDAELRQALDGSRAAGSEEAGLVVAVVGDETALEQALRVHAALPQKAPIWIVYAKGPRAAFGEGPVRKLMRDSGYKDNKVSAVSDKLSATRYVRQ